MSSSDGQFSQPRSWHLFQHAPHHLVSHASNIQSDSFVQLARLLNDEGVWSMDLGQERGGGVEGISPELLVAEPEERKVLVDISVQAGRDAAVVSGPHVDLTLAPQPRVLGVQFTGEEI